MTIYHSDKEQIEMLKDWWRENGKFILISIISAVLLSGIWHYWQDYKNNHIAEASLLYERTLVYESNKQYTEVDQFVSKLIKDYASTPYASLASFISVQNAIMQKELPQAVQKLDWVISHSRNKDFKQIARLRKARILNELKSYNQALSSLNVVDSDTYLPAILEVRGDILKAQGETQKAHLAYQQALSMLDQESPNRSLLQMKFLQSDN